MRGQLKGTWWDDIQGLIEEQRADGGWAQLPTLASDAYATGQALAALHESGALSYHPGVLHEINGTPYEFQFLTGHQAQNSRTFRTQFERETGQKFTPQKFRKDRLQLIDQADAIIVIRTGLSESTAFEVAYSIFAGPAVPIFFAIWDQAPIKTTLLRDLNEIVPVRYVTFSNPEELTKPLLDFFRTCAKDNGALSTNRTGAAFDRHSVKARIPTSSVA